MARRDEMIAALKRADMIEKLKMADAAPKEPDVVKDEMPEWLNEDDRSLVKNFTNNDEEKISTLQQKYPDSEFKKGVDGEIIMRKKGETAYGTLDPSFSPISNPMGTIKDLWNDTKDIGYDVVQGGAEAVGAAMGAPGGIAGVMAGSAGGAGAASFLKEKLRERLGITEKADMSNVLTDMAIGGVLPGALNVGGKAVKYGAKNLAPKSYGWLVGKNGKFLKDIAEESKAINPKTGKPYASKGDEIIDTSSDEALSGVEKLYTEFGDDVSQRLKDASSKYAEDGSDIVDISPVREAVDNEIALLRQSVADAPFSGSAKEELANAIKFRVKQFGPMNTKVKQIKLDELAKRRNSLADEYLPVYKEDVGHMVGKGVSSVEERLANLTRKKAKDQMNVATGGRVGEVDSEYVKLNKIANFGRDYLDKPGKIIATINKITEGKDDVLLGRFQRLPQELQDKIMSLKDEREMFNYLKSLNTKRVLTDENLGSAVGNATLGRSPIEKLLTLAGGAAGTSSGMGYPGMAAGLALGRGAGKLVAGPKSVLRVAKAGKKVGQKMDSLEKLIQEKPELLNLLYGGAYSLNE